MVTLLIVVLAASVLPCRGVWATYFEFLADSAIVLLFFMHGAKLSREAIVGGMLNWPLQIATLATTYVLFPMVGLMLIRLPGIDNTTAAGLLYLTLLPSTVQSSIAFTSMAGGNVPAAVCAATLSNLLGMVFTPILVTFLMHVPGAQPHISLEAIRNIGLQLLLPFIVGHLSRPWISVWLQKHKELLSRTDRVSILLVVYTAFSAAVVEGLWTRVSGWSLGGLVLVSGATLGIVFIFCWLLGKWLGLSREDAIVLLFCGSKKSLVSGVPMAGTLFPAAQVGLIILPLMIFHQLQIIACAVIARGLAGQVKPTESTSEEST